MRKEYYSVCTLAVYTSLQDVARDTFLLTSTTTTYMGQMLRYMLTGLPPGLSYLEHLEKQGVLLPLLKAAVRVARGKTRRPPRLALSAAKLSAPAKELIAQLTSKG